MKFTIETITPVTIGGDQADNLSPYADYIWNNGEFMYINPARLERFLNKDKMNEWVLGIQTGMDNTRSKFSLYNFITKHRIPMAEIVSKKVSLAIQPEGKAIRRHIHSAGRPYIPGSSIKGAIRTAMVYAFLEETPEGHKFINRFIQQLNKPDKEQKQNIRSNFTNPLKSLLDKNPMSDPFKYVQVTDSDFIDYGNVSIEPAARYHLKKLSEDSPAWREAIADGAMTNFSIRFTAAKTQLTDGFWQRLTDWDYIAQVLNQFSRASIENEINSLSNDFFVEVKRFYSDLLRQLNQIQKHEAILRIGAGKTFFDNTVDFHFKKFDREFYHFRELFGIGKKPGDKSGRVSRNFPNTRSFIGRNKHPLKPMGWIKINATQE